jgi:hypothetical protein
LEKRIEDIDIRFKGQLREMEGQLEMLQKPASDLINDLTQEKEAMLRELEKLYKS